MQADGSQIEIARSIVVRKIALTDAEAAAQLSAELGYPVDSEVMRDRIGIVNSSNDRIVYVALFSNVVVGWIDVGIFHHLATGAYGEIGGLIVSSEHRSAGIGQILVAEAERWIRAQGINRVVVRSRTSRESAHRFYLREGYSFKKTSAVFDKLLPAL